MSAPESFRTAFGRLSPLAKADAFVLAGLTLLLTAILWPAWTHDPDLTHGLLMPVVFCLLLRESRRAGPPRTFRPGPFPAAVVSVLSIVALAALAAAGLYSAAVAWPNSLVEFLLAAALAILLGAGLVAFADRRIRLFPFNWSAVVALCLWPLCAPIPPGTYSRLTLALQLWVSSGVMDALQLLGVAAHRQGNIIQLATGSVGIAEACSGVRSLVSCLFVALFFSGTLVRRPIARVLVVMAAAPLALAMNFFRALGLTLLVNSGVNIDGFWHDATGFAVLGLTAALLAGLAFGLAGGEHPTAGPGAAPAHRRSPTAPTALLAAALGAAIVLIAGYRLNQHSPERGDAPAPDLLSLLPPAPAGWTEKTAGDLGQFASALQTDHLAQRVYVKDRGPDQVQITVYLAYWQPGQASVALVAAHTPDACWPGAGWQERATPNPHLGLWVDGRQLAPAEARLFAYGSYPQHVWFWHLYDGRPIPYQNPYSLRELASIAWHYGFRRGGSQMFVSVASNRPWDEIAGEPVLPKLFGQLRALGL
jgi:exosortase